MPTAYHLNRSPMSTQSASTLSTIATDGYCRTGRKTTQQRRCNRDVGQRPAHHSSPESQMNIAATHPAIIYRLPELCGHITCDCWRLSIVCKRVTGVKWLLWPWWWTCQVQKTQVSAEKRHQCKANDNTSSIRENRGESPAGRWVG